MLILLITTEHEAPYLVINKQPDANSSINVPEIASRRLKWSVQNKDCGLGIKYGLGIKRGLETTDWVKNTDKV